MIQYTCISDITNAVVEDEEMKIASTGFDAGRYSVLLVQPRILYMYVYCLFAGCPFRMKHLN